MRHSRSRSRSPAIPQFPLILSFGSAVLNDSRSTLMADLISRYEIDRIHISDEMTINESPSRVVYIYSDSLRAKFESLRFVIDSLFPDRSNVEVVLFYQKLIDPAVLTKNISRSFQGFYKIVADLKTYTERMIQISGRAGDVERLVKDLHAFLIDKRPSPEPRSSHIEKSGAKFVLPEDLMQQVSNRGSSFFKRLKTESEVDVKIVRSSGPPCKDNDDVLIVSGKHRHVRRGLKSVVKQIIEVFDRNLAAGDQTLRMLILSTHVKELIGPQGAIIKDISKKAGNARIKVLSDTETEKNQEFTIVNIDGSNEAKIEAACKVYELLGKSDKSSPRPSPEDEELKIFVSVPDQYVARLIGRSGENVKAMMKSAKCKISFQKAPVSEFRNNDGEKIRLCYVSGNSSSISKGVKLLLEQISKLEAS